MVGVCVFIIQVSRGNVPVVDTLLQRFITQDLTTGRMDLNEASDAELLGCLAYCSIMFNDVDRTFNDSFFHVFLQWKSPL